MAEISLRNYIKNINDLLNDERYETAIAHSSHILSKYSKYVPAYRMLGRALVTQGRIDEAGEIYRRLLGALPNDFDTHFNLSAIYTRQNADNAALWHMERAFDQQPNNPDVIKRMRQLYKRFRDADIGRIQLTAGAVAKQYINAQLYDQAIELLERTLKRMPDRDDLRLQLAIAQWRNGDAVDAGETALDVLRKLPYSLEANQIMTELWLAEQRPSDARRYLGRVEDTDPYLAYKLVTGEQAPDSRFTIEELDLRRYQVQQMEKTNPDWLDALAAADETVDDTVDETGAATEDDLDDWLSGIEAVEMTDDETPAAPRRKVTDTLNPDTLQDEYEFPASAGEDDTVSDDDLADFEQLVSDAESDSQPTRSSGKYREGDLLSQMMDEAKDNPQGPTGMLARFATNEIGGEDDDLEWLIEATTGRFDTGSLAGLAGVEIDEDETTSDADEDFDAILTDDDGQDDANALDPMAWLGGEDQFDDTDDTVADDFASDFDDETDDSMAWLNDEATSDDVDIDGDAFDFDEQDDDFDFGAVIDDDTEDDVVSAVDADDPMAWLGDDFDYDEDAIGDFEAMQAIESDDDGTFESAPSDPMAWLGDDFDYDDANDNAADDDDPMAWMQADDITIEDADDDDAFDSVSGDVMGRLNAGEEVSPEEVDAMFRAGFEKANQRDVPDYIDEDEVVKADSDFLSELGLDSNDEADDGSPAAKADDDFLNELGFGESDSDDDGNEFSRADSDSDFLNDLGFGDDADDSNDDDPAWMTDSSVLDDVLGFDDDADEREDDFDFAAMVTMDTATEGQEDMSDQPDWEANFDDADDTDEEFDFDFGDFDTDTDDDDSIADDGMDWLGEDDAEDLVSAADADDPMAWLNSDLADDDADDEFAATADEDLLAEIGFEADDSGGDITGDAASDWDLDTDTEDEFDFAAMDFDDNAIGDEADEPEGEFDFASMDFDDNAIGDDDELADEFDLGDLESELDDIEEASGATGMLARFATGELNTGSTSDASNFEADDEVEEELDWLADLDNAAIDETTPTDPVEMEAGDAAWMEDIDDDADETEDEFDFAAMDFDDNAIGDELDESEDEFDLAAMDFDNNAIGDEADESDGEFDFAAMDFDDNTIGDEADIDTFEAAGDALDYAEEDLDDEFDFAAMDVAGDEDGAVGSNEVLDGDLSFLDEADDLDDETEDEFDFAAMDFDDNAIDDDADETEGDTPEWLSDFDEDSELDGDDWDETDDEEFETYATRGMTGMLNQIRGESNDADDEETTTSPAPPEMGDEEYFDDLELDDDFDDNDEALVAETPDWLNDMDAATEAEDAADDDDEAVAAELDWLDDDDEAMPEEAIPLAEADETVIDPDVIDDFEEELDFEAAASAPDWLNAMVPGLDIDYEAEEDESLEGGSFIQDPDAADNFAWLQAIVDEEIGDQQPLVREDEDEPVAIPTRPLERGQFVFSMLPAWARSTADSGIADGAGAAGVAATAAAATAAVDDTPDYLTDFDDFESDESFEDFDENFEDDFDEDALNDPYDDGYIESDFDEDFSLDEIDDGFDDFDDDFDFDDDAF